MISLVIFGRCARGKTREAALDHMRRVHGPMVYAPPPDAGPMPSAYAQNHVFDDAGALPADWRRDVDFVTEVGFADFAHLGAATSTPYYLDRLRPDEANFVDPPSVRAAPTRTLATSGVADAVQAFVFLNSTDDPPPPPDDPCLIGRASDVALPAPEGRPLPFDRLERLYFVDRVAARGYMTRRFAAYAETLAPRKGFALLADHYSVERMKGDAT